MISLVPRDEKERSPNRVLRSCLDRFDSVVIAGYGTYENGEQHILVHACENMTEEQMALISLKLARIAEIGWEESYD